MSDKVKIWPSKTEIKQGVKEIKANVKAAAAEIRGKK
jgi:hypothetical protein